MERWHFNVLFVIGCAGAIVLLFGKKIGLEVDPLAAGGVTTILGYVLTRKNDLVKDDKPHNNDDRHSDRDDEEAAK